METKSGTRVEAYEFEAILGKGMFGKVYLVRRKKDFKPFVIKEQNLSEAVELSFKLVLREVECLEKMRHPNIVAYHAGWIENNRSYILMEYATRGTLKDLLEKRQVPLVMQDALYLFAQITLGVHHIHKKQILHRDLKPENIMLTGRRGDIVKIGDFGVSKNLEDSVPCRAGSYNYMAPEMLLGQNYDLKCDIWSMGVILYEIVTKKLPFCAFSIQEIKTAVCYKRPLPFNKNISPAVINLISKMLRRQPANRPTTEQLVSCPYLVPIICRVYLNIGRSLNMFNQSVQSDTWNFDSTIFLNYIKPLKTVKTKV